MDPGRLNRSAARHLWHAAGGLLILLSALCGWRLAQIDGLLRPIHVSGPSMSPTLWGPHRHLSCNACGFTHPVQAAPAPPAGSLRCFSCGQTRLHLSDLIHSGDRVSIDRAAYRLTPPRLGDLVAIRTDEGGLQVKRIAALPGQRLRIDDRGTLWIDGRVQRIGPDEIWQRSVLVHDNRYPGPDGSRWRRVGSFLIYHHIDIHGGREPGTFPAAPVRDDDPANIGLSRLTRPVDDLQLAIELRAAESCQVEVVFAADRAPLMAAIPVAAGECQIRVAKIGSRLWKSIGDQPLQSVPLVRAPLVRAPPDLAALAPERPVAVRLRPSGREQRPAAEITHLWLGRAPRFDPPPDRVDQWRQGVTAPEGHYLVLGDNPPASVDSRHAPQGIKRERIIGRVIRQ